MALHDKLNPYPRDFAAVSRRTAMQQHRNRLPDADTSNYPSDRVYYVAHLGCGGFSIDPFLRICNLWSSIQGTGELCLRAAVEAGATGTCFISDGSFGWRLFMKHGWQPVESITTQWDGSEIKWTRFAKPYKET